MFYLQKILPAIVLPVMFVIILIIIGLIKNKKKIIYIAIGILYVLSTSIFSSTFFNLVEGSESRMPIQSIANSNAIVVLSGILEISEIGDSTYVDWGDPDRFFGGLALFKAGKAEKLIFTGGKMPWDQTKKTEGEILKEYAITSSISSDKIFVTKEVKNTEEEAAAVKELLNKSKRIILVTSGYHMYRAKKLFEKQGFIVTPYLVDFKTKRNSSITIIDFLPSAGNLELVETGSREIIGRFYYFIKDIN
jgi:uncharacterized SAM-binding protein YcdF (DUF218 family)